MFFDRHVLNQEFFVTFAFTPVLGEAGNAEGMFCTLVDTTESVLEKRRLDTLHALTVAAAATRSLAAAAKSLVDVLGKSDDVSFAAMYLSNGDSRERASTGIAPHATVVDDQVLARLIENDAQLELSVDVPHPTWPEHTRRALALPIRCNADISGVLLCGFSPRRPFDSAYHRFFDLISAQVSAALADVHLPGSGEPMRKQADALLVGHAKESFLAILGHELRNPLSALMTTLQTLMLRAPSADIELMERSVRQLSRVVDNLLDISRIARGKLELQVKSTELAPIVDRAMELVTALFSERKNQVFVRVPRVGFRLEADPERIAQVIANVLTNASRYSEPGSRIWLEASHVDDRMRLTIRDEGSGIEPERMASVFETFYLPPELRPRSSGLGLGLAISRSLVELHGGTLQVHSEGHGRGTECVIELRHDAQMAAIARTPRPLVRKRLLLVEDNDDTARALKNGLEQLGYTVAVAHNAPIALNLARTFDPDVALLDIGLPVMDGWELARRLREQRAPRELFIVAVTAYDQEADKRRSEEAGFSEHLIKPIDLAKLEQVVEALASDRQ